MELGCFSSENWFLSRCVIVVLEFIRFALYLVCLVPSVTLKQRVAVVSVLQSRYGEEGVLFGLL